jgi:hypothetical protein
MSESRVDLNLIISVSALKIEQKPKN